MAGDTFGELDLVLSAARTNVELDELIENLNKMEVDLVRHFTI